MQRNGIRHIKSAPYHPASNGQVERLVQSFKQSLKAGKDGGRTLAHRLASFLLTYRSTPHATTGKSPSQLFLKRDIRTRFDLLKPDCEKRVLEKQSHQKSSHDLRAKKREWFVGQRVMARNMRPGPNYVPATILEVLGPVTYLVETDGREIWKRHLDQLKVFEQSSPQVETTEQANDHSEFPTIPLMQEESDTNNTSDPPEIELESNGEEVQLPDLPNRSSRYPSRVRLPPDRFM